MFYYQKAKAIYLKKQKKDRLAELWVHQGNIKNAHLAFDTCFSYQQFFQPYTAADYYNKLAKLLLKEHKTQEAIIALEKGLTLADSVQFKEIAFDNLQQLVQIYQQLGKFEKANLYLQKAFQLQKILENDNNLLKFKHLELEYDLELQAKEIEQQQAALQQSTIIHWIMGIATFLLAALLFFTWRQLNEKKKAVAYSKVLLKELHHRVKNNLQNIVSIVRLQSRSIQDAEAKLVIKDSQERLEAIAILHQQFYQNEDINQVDFSRFLENLMKNKLFLQNLDGKEIKYLISTDSNSVSIENSLPIALIINELVTNSIKHAFKESNVIQPQINITIKDKTMVYTDNGISKSATINEKSMKSFGSQLISDLCLQLDGNYQMDRSDGFRFELKF